MTRNCRFDVDLQVKKLRTEPRHVVVLLFTYECEGHLRKNLRKSYPILMHFIEEVFHF